MKAWIRLIDGTVMYSASLFKILGFTFSDKPTIHAQINYIINRAASSFFLIRRFAGIVVDKSKVKNLYCSLVRSIMEYSSVTYGPMLAKYQSNKLENLQKRCLRTIYGYDKSYDLSLIHI